jgi:hypothetical protein
VDKIPWRYYFAQNAAGDKFFLPGWPYRVRVLRDEKEVINIKRRLIHHFIAMSIMVWVLFVAFGLLDAYGSLLGALAFLLIIVSMMHAMQWSIARGLHRTPWRCPFLPWNKLDHLRLIE